MELSLQRRKLGYSAFPQRPIKKSPEIHYHGLRDFLLFLVR